MEDTTLDMAVARLEEINEAIKEINEQLCALKRENKLSTTHLEAVDDVILKRKESMANFKHLQDKPREIAKNSKKKIIELTQKKIELLTEKQALERSIAEMHKALEFIESEQLDGAV